MISNDETALWRTGLVEIELHRKVIVFNIQIENLSLVIQRSGAKVRCGTIEDSEQEEGGE